jgi:hypothetical protein
VSLILLVTPALSQNNQKSVNKYTHLRKGGFKTALNSLKGIYVKVNYNGPKEGEYYLSADSLRFVVDEELNANGIPVLKKNQIGNYQNPPYLLLDVVGSQLVLNGKPADGFFFTINLNLIERVLLERYKKEDLNASTWSEGYSIIVPREDITTVPLKILDLVREFSNDFNKVNK